MFSIIIPLYNKADYIAETLKSVLNQTYCDYEVIVVNDSSTDNSLEVASSFQDERIHIYTKENEGVSAARNYGIMHAKYDYIAFLDADDIWESDYLECQKKLIEIYPDAGIYSTAFYSLEKGKRKLRNVLINEHTHFLVHDYFKDNIVYINVMKNMSVDCDCCAVAEDPCMKDIGILISTDPIAIDQACLDLVYASDDPGKEHLIERIESRNGVHTIEAAEALGYGSRDYELIEIK